MRTLTIANSTDLENVIRTIERGEEAAAGGEAHLEQQLASTRAIVEAVRVRGDAAVAEFTQKYDGVALDPADLFLGISGSARQGLQHGEAIRRTRNLCPVLAR